MCKISQQKINSMILRQGVKPHIHQHTHTHIHTPTLVYIFGVYTVHGSKNHDAEERQWSCIHNRINDMISMLLRSLLYVVHI